MVSFLPLAGTHVIMKLQNPQTKKTSKNLEVEVDSWGTVLTENGFGFFNNNSRS